MISSGRLNLDAGLKMTVAAQDKIAEVNRNLDAISKAGNSAELIQASVRLREARFWLEQHQSMIEPVLAQTGGLSDG